MTEIPVTKAFYELVKKVVLQCDEGAITIPEAVIRIMHEAYQSDGDAVNDEYEAVQKEFGEPSWLR